MRLDSSRACWRKQERSQHKEDLEEMTLVRQYRESHDKST
jgi:hypothetical protein